MQNERYTIKVQSFQAQFLRHLKNTCNISLPLNRVQVHQPRLPL
jgi:hypothetical protein